MHHAIADGIALARVMLSLTDEGGRPAGLRAAARRRRRRAGGSPALAGRATRPAQAAASAARAVVHEGVETLLHPERLAPLARAAEVDLRAALKLLLPGTDPQTPLKGDAHVAHRVAWADPVPLTTIKRAGRARGATVNDVLVAAVAGAVGRHLRRTTAGDVDEVHALVPFNLRPLDQPLPRDLGNRFGLILLGLPVGVMDPLERLRAVQERMGADQGLPRGRDRLRHPRADRPHAGGRRDAAGRLLQRARGRWCSPTSRARAGRSRFAGTPVARRAGLGAVLGRRRA